MRASPSSHCSRPQGRKTSSHTSTTGGTRTLSWIPTLPCLQSEADAASFSNESFRHELNHKEHRRPCSGCPCCPLHAECLRSQLETATIGNQTPGFEKRMPLSTVSGCYQKLSELDRPGRSGVQIVNPSAWAGDFIQGDTSHGTRSRISPWSNFTFAGHHSWSFSQNYNESTNLSQGTHDSLSTALRIGLTQLRNLKRLIIGGAFDASLFTEHPLALARLEGNHQETRAMAARGWS